MNRRRFLRGTAAVLSAGPLLEHPLAWAQPAPDYRLEIAPLKLEIAPGKVMHTFGYNGQAPGPLLRWPEGKQIRIEVTNHTDRPEVVHWHGMFTPSRMDGAMEEGSPMISPGEIFTYDFAPRPCRISLVSHAYVCRTRSEAGPIRRPVRLLLCRAEG